jgi:hypothetical protein
VAFHDLVRQLGVADVDAFWRALFADDIVAREWVAELVRPHSADHGLGFWLGNRRPGAAGGLRRRRVVPLGARPGERAPAPSCRTGAMVRGRSAGSSTSTACDAGLAHSVHVVDR